MHILEQAMLEQSAAMKEQSAAVKELRDLVIATARKNRTSRRHHKGHRKAHHRTPLISTRAAPTKGPFPASPMKAPATPAAVPPRILAVGS